MLIYLSFIRCFGNRTAISGEWFWPRIVSLIPASYMRMKRWILLTIFLKYMLPHISFVAGIIIMNSLDLSKPTKSIGSFMGSTALDSISLQYAVVSAQASVGHLRKALICPSPSQRKRDVRFVLYVEGIKIRLGLIAKIHCHYNNCLRPRWKNQQWSLADGATTSTSFSLIGLFKTTKCDISLRRQSNLGSTYDAQ